MNRDLYTAIVSGLFFPLHEGLKRHSSVSLRRFLEGSQWWDREQLEAWRLARLKGLLEGAATHVPYYRKLFAGTGFVPGEMSSLSDLSRLPFLTKSLIRDNLEGLKSERAKGLARFNTGGSSGEPLIFHIGRERVSHDVAAKWRATRWWGVDVGDPEIVLWGSPIELGRQDRVKAIRDRIMRTELLPAFEMSRKNLDGFLARLRGRRPKMLFGYPSAFAHIARHALRKGVHLDDLGVEVAFVTSERLYEDQRALISRVFGCPVANGYGSRDAGFIAHECPLGGMHVTAEDVIVEIVDRDGRPLPCGQAGEVVVTHLATRDFPFIRYRTGDVAVLDDGLCACGRGLPLIGEIQGRTTDFVVAADGTVMHGLALIYILRDLPGVAAFKIVQQDLLRTEVLLVATAGFDRGKLPEIGKAFRRRLGERVTVDIRLVAEIPPEKSGKYRYVQSHVMAATPADGIRAG